MNQYARLLFLSAIACGGAACYGQAEESTDPGELSAAACAAAPAWVVGHAYHVGDLVTFQGNVYSCLQAHTSQSDWTPAAVPALWTLQDCNGGGSGGSGSGGSGSGGSGSGGSGSGGGSGGNAGGFVFSPYKDVGINMDFNLNVISTLVSGTRTPIGTDLKSAGGRAVTLAFATGECGNENWAGVPGPTMAQANVSRLNSAGADYVISTGGAAGSFTCSSDSGFSTFVNRWASPHLIGVDFDIEVGQSSADITNLVRRIQTSHTTHPGLRYSLTIATLANTDGSESLNATGVATLQAVHTVFGNTVPSFVTINLMTMDYGSPSQFVCVVANGTCDMGQSAIQAARNLNSKHGIPFGNIELTPMIGGNDVQSNVFRLNDVNTMASFVTQNHLAGVHFWSYDRDVDCAPGPASSTCNSLGGAGVRGFLRRFMSAGVH